MEGKTHDFRILSATVMGIVCALRAAGAHVKTAGQRTYDTEPIVRYDQDAGAYPGMSETFQTQLKIKYFISFHLSVHDNSMEESQGLQNRAQLITYPRGNPCAMIEAIPAIRSVLNRMRTCWDLGAQAAKAVSLHATAEQQLSLDSEVYYEVKDCDRETSRYAPELGILATHAFPRLTQKFMEGLQWLSEGIEPAQMAWLGQHTGLEFLLNKEPPSSATTRKKELAGYNSKPWSSGINIAS